MADNKKLAVVLIRTTIGAPHEIKDTLRMLNLSTKNACALVEETPAHAGMIILVKDYVTWGEIDEETLKLLIEKRGKEHTKHGKKESAPFFNLHPPRGGFERKGIKTPFTTGGALGYRGDKINPLIKRMI